MGQTWEDMPWQGYRIALSSSSAPWSRQYPLALLFLTCEIQRTIISATCSTIVDLCFINNTSALSLPSICSFTSPWDSKWTFNFLSEYTFFLTSYIIVCRSGQDGTSCGAQPQSCISLQASRWWPALCSILGGVWFECTRLHFQVVTYLSWAVVRKGSTRLVRLARPGAALMLGDRWVSLPR